jgi:predicted NBD/HSP70 family sugar kinase
MGVVIDGELVRGAHGAAGEIAYLPSSGDPFDERHRLHGGLEDEIGAEGILAAVRARRDASSQMPGSAQDVFELAQAGDRDAQLVVADVARRLGSAIASVIAVVDPELVVLGGGIGSNPSLLAPVRATVAELMPLSARIETSTLGDKAALSGAIALALREARAQLFRRAAR